MPDRDQLAPLLIDTREAARLLRISERLLWTLTRKGNVKCVRLGRRVLYDPADLRELIERMKSGATATV